MGFPQGRRIAAVASPVGRLRWQDKRRAAPARPNPVPAAETSMPPCRPALAILLLAASAAHANDAARAEEIVQGQCVICHGAEGESSTPVFPRLAAQHADYVSRQLADFQAGRRKSPVMEPMTRELTAADMQAIGRWFESKPARAHPVADPALAEQGRAIYDKGLPSKGVPACRKCHGLQGEGTETLPRLGGQHAAYLESQLRAFGKRERTNDNEVMQTIAARITDAELRAVSSYMSGMR
jgi:cytochrome c553